MNERSAASSISDFSATSYSSYYYRRSNMMTSKTDGQVKNHYYSTYLAACFCTICHPTIKEIFCYFSQKLRNESKKSLYGKRRRRRRLDFLAFCERPSDDDGVVIKYWTLKLGLFSRTQKIA